MSRELRDRVTDLEKAVFGRDCSIATKDVQEREEKEAKKDGQKKKTNE